MDNMSILATQQTLINFIYSRIMPNKYIQSKFETNLMTTEKTIGVTTIFCCL